MIMGESDRGKRGEHSIILERHRVVGKSSTKGGKEKGERRREKRDKKRRPKMEGRNCGCESEEAAVAQMLRETAARRAFDVPKILTAAAPIIHRPSLTKGDDDDERRRRLRKIG